jgi:hypothetical protein
VDRRRVFWVTVAVVAGAALVMLNRPGGEADEPASDVSGGSTPAGQPAPPAAATRPPDTAVPTVAATSAPPEMEPPYEPSGVTEEETLDPAALAGAVEAAEQFAAIWSTPDTQWYERLAGLATPALAEALASAEPPATARRITGDGQVFFDAPEWARIGVPADAGTVVLDVVIVDGKWLVSAVDWRPS